MTLGFLSKQFSLFLFSVSVYGRSGLPRVCVPKFFFRDFNLFANTREVVTCYIFPSFCWYEFCGIVFIFFICFFVMVFLPLSSVWFLYIVDVCRLAYFCEVSSFGTFSSKFGFSWAWLKMVGNKLSAKIVALLVLTSLLILYVSCIGIFFGKCCPPLPNPWPLCLFYDPFCTPLPRGRMLLIGSCLVFGGIVDDMNGFVFFLFCFATFLFLF